MSYTTNFNLLSYLMDLVSIDINYTQSSVSSTDAATAQLLNSEFTQLNGSANDAIVSIVCEVALTKKAVLNTDPRAISVKNFIISINNTFPPSVQFTNSQLAYFFPVLF